MEKSLGISFLFQELFTCKINNQSVDIIVRKATVDDAVEMNKLNRKTLPENYSLLEWTSVLSLQNESFVAYTVENSKEKYLVGYCFGLVTKHNGCLKGVIASIAVHKYFRKQNIAFILIKKSISALLEQVSTVFLYVRISNTLAQNLYKKTGFIITNCHKNYYADTEDASVMEVSRLEQEKIN